MGIRWKSDHLWLYLLALGFDSKADKRNLVLGANMFDKPNTGAFHAIALFLFAKLDKRRAAKAFRDCSFPLAKFSNPEFRKKCCMWLKDIASKDRRSFPQITPSSLSSPGGPKFVQLFYQFARHVMIEDMKRNSVGADIPFAEAVRLSPKDMYMANARRRVAYNKLLQIFQKEDFVIKEYKKKAQLLIKEINQIKSEYAVLQIQSCRMKQNDQNKNDKTERIQKVRSMWTLIMGMLTSLKKEKEVVDSVLHPLENCVGQCILDGTNVVFSVPQLLLHRVESDIDQLCTGNVYEAEKLNFLTVIQLLNEALRTLRDEHCQYEFKDLHVIESRITLFNKILQDLAAKRLTIEQQHCVSASESVSRKQEDWDVKWKSFLSPYLFNLILDQDPAFYLLRASSPHSWDLAEEQDNDNISVICQQLVSYSDVYDSVPEVRYKKDDEALETMMDKSTPPPRWISSEPLELSKASENKDMLIEKNLRIETWKGKKRPVPPKILKNGKDESATSEMRENAGDHVIQTESPVKKEDPLEKARDELAEEVARTVISESPHSSEGKEMALEDLISSMAFNPFLTRKEIPRTPENLLTEIRNSWRKAIQTEASSDIELAPAEVVIEEAPMDAGPVMQKAVDSRFVCSTHASLIPDVDPPLSERKSQLSYTEFRPQEQMRISHIESEILEASGMRESERTEEQELKCIVLNKSSVEDTEEQTFPRVKKSMNIPDTCSENNSRTNVLPSGHFWSSLMDGMLLRNVSSQLSAVTHEDYSLGILDETLPEELDNIDSNKSASSGSDFDVMDEAYVTDGSKNKDDTQKYEQPFQNTYEALKKTAFRSEEELHQIHNGGESVCCRSDLSLAPEKRQRGELCSPLACFCLDEEFTKMPSPISASERKYSLSSLLVSCQHLEEMASMVHEISLDVIHKLKNEEQLNEKPGMKEPMSE